MTQETKEQLIKRLKSFSWRMGAYVVVSALAFVVDNIGLLQIDPFWVTIITLICGEVTKYVNTFSTK